MAGGVTTLEVKSGYGLTVGEELRGLSICCSGTFVDADATRITRFSVRMSCRAISTAPPRTRRCVTPI